MFPRRQNISNKCYKIKNSDGPKCRIHKGNISELILQHLIKDIKMGHHMGKKESILKRYDTFRILWSESQTILRGKHWIWLFGEIKSEDSWKSI